MVESLKQAISEAIQEALFGLPFDDWKIDMLTRIARWRLGFFEAGAILIVGWVMSSMMHAIDAKGAARTLRPISKLMALARLLTAIFGRL